MGEPVASGEPRLPTSFLAAGAITLIAAGVAAAFWMVHPFVRKFDLIDLAVYRAAGKAVTHGHSVFGPYVGKQLRVPLPFIYPPIAAVLAIPFTWLNETPANLLWTAITVVLLGAVVRRCFASLLDRYGRAAPFAFVLVLGAMAATTPVEDHLRFGQVGIALMACCVLDCVPERPRLLARVPRGVLVGLATAFKLVPGIFIPYLALTRRWRAAAVAAATFVVLTWIGFAAAAHDSWDFWTDRMFQPTSPKFFSNQSLEGMLQRAIGPWRLIWLPAVAFVLVYGLRKAAVASRSGDELRGIAITGLAGALVSPISWIHHLVWVIPAIAVVIGRGTDKRRVVLAFVLTALFIARLPYVGNDELHGTGFFAGLLEDSYGLLTIGLLVLLTRTPARTATRSRPISSAARH